MSPITLSSIPLHHFMRLLTLGRLPEHVLNVTNWLDLIQSHLYDFGSGEDLPGFLDACLKDALWSPGDTLPYWCTVRIVDDFDFLGGQGLGVADSSPVGARIELLNTESRRKVPQQIVTPNPRYMFLSEQLDRTAVINRQGTSHQTTAILTSTLNYVLHRATTATPTSPALGPENEDALHLLQQHIESISTRIEANSKSIRERMEETKKVVVLVLYAVLMKREGFIINTEWDLYLCDYINAEGNLWRKVSQDSGEEMLSEKNFLDRLRNSEETSWSTLTPSTTPWYLFYIDADAIVSSTSPSLELSIPVNLPLSPAPDMIMLDEPSNVSDGQDKPCKTCGGEESLEDNRIFFCDGCDEGLHQLCRDPPIDSNEEFIEPWFCPTCKHERETRKRKRDEEHEAR